jgi:uncharacterized membrane protein (TIGR02234 family)
VSPARREFAVALGGTLVGAALILLAAGRPWAHVGVSNIGASVSRVSLSGHAVAPLPSALAIAALASCVALLATRGLLRIVIGVVLAGLGTGAFLSSAAVTEHSVRQSGALADKISLAPLADAHVAVALTAWRHVSVLGSLLVLGAALLVCARGRTWMSMGRKYDAPTPAVSEQPMPAAENAHLSDHDLWERLDAGDDPTV